MVPPEVLVDSESLPDHSVVKDKYSISEVNVGCIKTNLDREILVTVVNTWCYSYFTYRYWLMSGIKFYSYYF